MKFIEKGKVAVIFDGQFGSTGKGSIAGKLAQDQSVDIAVTNASANAGHWTKISKTYQFCTHHLPTFGVVQSSAIIYLNAGSVISPQVLLNEIETMKIDPKRIKIHPMAAIITPEHVARENALRSQATMIASTRQGVGAALADKIQRLDNIAMHCSELEGMIGSIDLNTRLAMGRKVVLEIPQGYSLSLNSRFYPNVTSRNCTVMAGLADAGIHSARLGKVLMTMRTFPIRVGHIYNKKTGKIIGSSGNVYPDQRELDWEKDFPGITPEQTTVTGRQRRIFTFSMEQFTDSVINNRPDILFLNFVNYMTSVGETNYLVDRIRNEYTAIMRGFPEMLYGHGPMTDDITDSWREEK